jgi:precorrin-6B methylase 2
MVALADIRPGQQVLEPSAGTGRIIDAIRRNAHASAITAVELNCNMAHRLRTVDGVDDTRQADFLECNGDLGTFDRIVMNPPFANADDIKHIMHALKMLKSGGRLVAICANGPRQNDKLRHIVEARGGIWEEGALQADAYAGFHHLYGNDIYEAACRVGEDVATLTPHRPGRADFPHPVPHGRASLPTM